MRLLSPLIVCAAALTAGVALGGEPSSADGKPPKHLTQTDIEQAIAHDVDAVARCYKKFGLRHKKAKGELRIELVVHRRGYVKRVSIDAPGVRGKKLERCVRPLAQAWSFPERRYFTVASVPFFFLRTDAKGAGPMHSCWSAKGCPTRRRANRRNR